jgi:hypothetical protein
VPRELLLAAVRERAASLGCALEAGSPARLPARLKVGRSGAVRGVEFTDRELPQGLSGCLRAQILGWTFQDIDLPSDVEVLITFTLSPRA